jgi:Nif-specific regulatory protein
MTTENDDIAVSPGNGGRHAGELEALYSTSRVLISDMSQQQMLEEVLDILDRDLDMKRGTIMLLSPDGTELVFDVAHSVSHSQGRAVRYQPGEGINGRVLQSNQPAVVPKISEEPMFLDRLQRQKKAGDEEMSFVCVPISIANKAVGTLSADRPYDEATSLDEDVRLLSIVASAIAGNVKSRRDSAAARQVLEDENTRLQHELEDRFRPENIIGNSGVMREVYNAIHQVASGDTTVVIRGESGTGKELVAHALHYSSLRAKGAFVKVNCAALSENLLESELFGHEKGAFTGAIQTRIGRIEEAEGGTLFLDEIGDFSPAVQVKLLRVLQEREFERVGSNETRKANVRIVCATNRDLEKLVETEEFRQDVYYRINVFPIFLPPLRDRKDDILLLADYFVEEYSRSMGKKVRRISTPAINMMVAYHWPGNVRELENCIERAVLLSNEGVIHGHHLPPTLQTADASGTGGTGSMQDRVDLFERDIIVDALKRTYGNMAASARDLSITSRILRYKVKVLAVDPARYRRKR